MKYIVDVNGTRHDVVMEGDSATMADFAENATLTPANGTPVRLLRLGDRTVRVLAQRGETRGAYVLEIDGYKYAVDALDERTRAIRDMTAKSAAAAGPAPLKAPMPGLIVRVHVKAGDQVEPGQGLVVM
jgi:pyruvate carboxylase subunit B